MKINHEGCSCSGSETGCEHAEWCALATDQKGERRMKIRDKKTNETREATIEEAARITELDPDEIRWAIEEHGRCDTDTHAIGETEAEIQGEWEDEQEDPDRPRTTPAMPMPRIRLRLDHPDGVSGTTIQPDGRRGYWTEGRSSTIAIVHPDGTRTDVDVGTPEAEEWEECDDARPMTKAEIQEWERERNR